MRHALFANMSKHRRTYREIDLEFAGIYFCVLRSSSPKWKEIAMNSRIDYRKTSAAVSRNFNGFQEPLQKISKWAAVPRIPAHCVRSKFACAAPAVAMFLVGSGAFADTSDVKGPRPVIVAKSGEHCKDDPNCFNRVHYAVKPVARVKPGQKFILETRDGLDSDLDFSSTAEDVAAVDLNRCHPLTGPVYIEGAKKGDSIAVTVVDIEPDEFGTTTVVPGFGFLRDLFTDPYIVHWDLNRLEARSKDMPGISVPNNSFMGTIGVLPDKEELQKWLKREQELADAGGAVLTPQPVEALPADLCGVDGTAKSECLRTVPPRENGGNVDARETIVGTTILLPCFIDGCGLFAGDVHFAMGGGEVAGTAIETGGRVTLEAQVRPGGAKLQTTMHFEGGSQLKQLAPSSFYAISGLPVKSEGELPVFETYLGGEKIAPLANLSEDLTLAARNATLNMIDFLVKTKGLTREQAYVLTSVAVDLNIAQVVDYPNVGVTAILNRDVFKEQ
jgi:formamidase